VFVTFKFLLSLRRTVYNYHFQVQCTMYDLRMALLVPLSTFKQVQVGSYSITQVNNLYKEYLVKRGILENKNNVKAKNLNKPENKDVKMFLQTQEDCVDLSGKLEDILMKHLVVHKTNHFTKDDLNQSVRHIVNTCTKADIFLKY